MYSAGLAAVGARIDAALAALSLSEPYADPRFQPEERDEPWPGPDEELPPKPRKPRTAKDTLLPAFYPPPPKVDPETAIRQQTESIEAHFFAAEWLAEARREVILRRVAAIKAAKATKAAAAADTGDDREGDIPLSAAEVSAISKRVHREVANQFGFGDRLPLAPQQMNSGAQGTQKTWAAIRAIAATPTESTFLFGHQTTEKAAEALRDYWSVATPESAPAKLLLGRSQEDPERPGQFMCPRWEAAESVAKANLSVKDRMCLSCEIADECGTNRQVAEVQETVDGGRGLVAFGSNYYNFLPAALHDPDHRIVDEDVTDIAVSMPNVRLDTFDNLPIACPVRDAVSSMRAAFADLDDTPIPQSAGPGLTTIRQALATLERAPDPAVALGQLRAALRDNAKLVAEALLGPPARALDTEHRWWRRDGDMMLGVMTAGPMQGTAFDYYAREGGDLLWLIQRQLQCGADDAAEWAAGVIGMAWVNVTRLTATIRGVVDQWLHKNSFSAEALGAIKWLHLVLTYVENIPKAHAARATLLRIRDLIGQPQPLSALHDAGIDEAALREVRWALNAAVARNTPDISGGMADAAIISAVKAAEKGAYGNLRRAAALVSAIIAEIDHWRQTLKNIAVRDGKTVRIGKKGKSISLAPLAKLPAAYLADICRIIADADEPIAALRREFLDMKLGFVRSKLEAAIAASGPGDSNTQHLRQAYDLLGAMIPEVVQRRATCTGIVVRNGVAQISKLLTPRLDDHTSLLLLNGTGNYEHACAIFRTDKTRLHHIETRVPRKARITGTRKRGYGALSFTAKTRKGEVLKNRSVEAGNLRADAHKILERLPTGNTVVLATKRVEDILLATGVIKGDTPHGHFGALRGKNKWDTCLAALIIGAESVAIDILERKARAFMVTDWRSFVSMDHPPDADWPRRQWPYVCTRMRRMANGTLSPVEVEVHPDPRVQEVYEQTREAELVQALDRVRPVLHNREIVLMNNLCLDADYDRIMTHRELVAGGDKLDQAFLATGFVPRTPFWLHKAHDKIFPTEAVAEHALRHWREFVERWSKWEPAVVSFRTAKQRGPDSQAVIDPSRHPDMKATIEAVTGPLQEFQGVPCNPSPDDSTNWPTSGQSWRPDGDASPGRTVPVWRAERPPDG